MTVFIAHLAAIPIDGCSINPARSFGAAVAKGEWNHQWLFWVAPIAGGLSAAIVYELLFRPGARAQEWGGVCRWRAGWGAGA